MYGYFNVRDDNDCVRSVFAEDSMAHIGELLHVIRLEWGLTLREVMHRSQIHRESLG